VLEMELVHTDNQENVNLVSRQSVNEWRMIYSLMDNVKTSMDLTYQEKNGKITNQDVDGIIDYIYMSLKNITRNTIGGK
jgi:hypothetical protein